MFDSFLKKRAEKEITIVRNCKKKYSDLAGIYAQEVENIRAELIRLEQMAREQNDKGDREAALALARRHKARSNELQHSEGMRAVMEGEVELLERLMDAIHHLFLSERYYTIIKAIPERRLPRLLKNPDSIREVHELCTDILSTLLDYIDHHGFCLERAAAEAARIEEESARFRAENNLYRSDSGHEYLEGLLGRSEVPDDIVYGDEHYTPAQKARKARGTECA